MNIPEIKNNIDLVSIIDELKHRIKPLTIKPNGTLMGQSFNDLLNKFIEEWKLDKDQHSFASFTQEEIEEEREKICKEFIDEEENKLNSKRITTNIPSFGTGYITSDQIKTSISKINLNPIWYESAFEKDDKTIEECVHSWISLNGSKTRLSCEYCGLRKLL